LQPAVAGYAAHADEGLSAPEVVAFLNDLGAGAGIAYVSPFGPEYVFNYGDSSRLSAAALSVSKFVVVSISWIIFDASRHPRANQSILGP
jgi:hypothetical protein